MRQPSVVVSHAAAGAVGIDADSVGPHLGRLRVGFGDDHVGDMMTDRVSLAQARSWRHAKRNYDRLLEQARNAFAEYGVDASLDDIARRAGRLTRHGTITSVTGYDRPAWTVSGGLVGFCVFGTISVRSGRTNPSAVRNRSCPCEFRAEVAQHIRHLFGFAHLELQA
jgi:hypothetical protein